MCVDGAVTAIVSEVGRRFVRAQMDQHAEQEQAEVARALEGDLDAFRMLYERYQRRILAVAVGILGSVEDAEDAMQEAFVKAHRNLKSFRRESGFYTWLYRITYNVCIDMTRKRYRSAEFSTDDTATLERASQRAASSGELLSGTELSPVEFVERKELQSKIGKAMTQLTPEHRAVIILREVEGLSYAEISASLGCSKGTVMSRLFHARRNMQKALGGDYAAVINDHEADATTVCANGDMS